VQIWLDFGKIEATFGQRDQIRPNLIRFGQNQNLAPQKYRSPAAILLQVFASVTLTYRELIFINIVTNTDANHHKKCFLNCLPQKFSV